MIRKTTLAVLLALISVSSFAADDLGEFGSGEPLPRKDEPKRGVLKFTEKQGVTTNMDHWMQRDWTFQAKRSGHYQVRLTYILDHASLGLQFKLGETRLRKTVTGSLGGRSTSLGEVFISEPGKMGFAIYTPTNANGSGFTVSELALVPTNEGEPKIEPAADGSITLHAKDATTWSETMRYESKPEKNCLGYWTDPDDIAEWEFEVIKPGKYEVLISQGCDGGNAGSEVAIKTAGQEKKFTVQDTGGFQNWKEIRVGEIEIKEAGTQRLVVDPVNKVKAAVLDVQKVVLKPVL